MLEQFVNSAKTQVRGLESRRKQGFDLGGTFGKLTLTAQWTHLFTFKRTEQDGTARDFAGTHGSCDVSNCAGTPADKINFGAFVDSGPFRIGANLQYRASIENRNFKGEPGCGSSFADGSDAPAGCRRIVHDRRPGEPLAADEGSGNLRVAIRNVFDRVAPFDPFSAGTIAGAVSYNPMDTAGAAGRFYSIGVRYKFF